MKVVLSALTMLKVTKLIIIVLIACEHGASAFQNGGLFHRLSLLPSSAGRSLRQQYSVSGQQQSPYGQFSPITNRIQNYGGWGGSWLPGNTRPAPVNAVVTTGPSNINAQVGNTVLNPGTSGLASSQLGTNPASNSGVTVNMGGTPGPSSSSSGSTSSSSSSISGNIVTSGSGVTTQMPINTTSTGQTGTNMLQTGVNSAGAQVTSSGQNIGMAAIGSEAQPGLQTSSMPAQSGSIGATAAATMPPNPINAGVVNTQATAFDPGYCVPRQSFVTINVTALACNPGSNLTKWDGKEVCARIDCDTKLDSGNVIYAPTFCRTVVEPVHFICPKGCETVLQTFKNTTDNTTREVTRCACRAGNQPCPGTYTGCVCQPAWIPSFNTSMSYVLCSSDETMCDTWCNRTANQLGPLCPFFPDSTLPLDPAFSGPIYPNWGWNIASQGQATAAVAPGTPIGRRLLRFTQLGHRMHMRLFSSASGSSSSSSSSWDTADTGFILPSDARRVWYPDEYGVAIDSIGNLGSDVAGSGSKGRAVRSNAVFSSHVRMRSGWLQHLQQLRQRIHRGVQQLMERS